MLSSEYNYIGRNMIFSDVARVDASNVINVVSQTYADHITNKEIINYLDRYERGDMPILNREKSIRPDINEKITDPIANEITDFKVGYQWGNPITYIQRSKEDLNSSDAGADNKAISQLNEMLADENAFEKDSALARWIEICGIGYQMIDIKRDYNGGSVFDLVTLDPRYTYIVYDRTVRHDPLCSVQFVTYDSGNTYFTVFTKERRYEIKNMIELVNEQKKETWIEGERSGELNPLGMIPVVEYVRSHDRMGVFERCIPEINGLTVLESDVVNGFAQDVQACWLAIDIDFPTDEKGNPISPKNGQWILSYSKENGQKPDAKALVIANQYDNILSNISNRREIIKQQCAVPTQAEATGGSTGTAMQLSSGWQNAEVAASKEAAFTKASKMRLLDLIIRAVNASTDTPKGLELKRLHKSDCAVSIIRNKNYDMATKANTFATWISHGIHPLNALEQVEAFADNTQVYENSKETLEKYQDNLFEKEEKRLQQDTSDQLTNSPILDSMRTKDSTDAGENKERTNNLTKKEG